MRTHSSSYYKIYTGKFFILLIIVAIILDFKQIQKNSQIMCIPRDCITTTQQTRWNCVVGNDELLVYTKSIR